MGTRMRTGRGSASGLAIVLAVVGMVSLASAADHPTLVDPEKTSCETCHDEILAVSVPHPPAADDCLTCHSFDRSEGQTTVELMETGAALCLACHDDYAGAAEGAVAVPHAPVIDDCAACHDPHGTEFDALLVAAPGGICLECHDAEDTDEQHPIPVSRADCRSCHEAHGSENPHMLRGVSQHTPFEEGSCEACHRKPRGTRVRLLQEGGALCEACHGDMAGDDDAVVHTALRQGRCVGCHDPHLADRPDLLKADGGELCFPCHPEIAERATGPGAHAALEDGCDSCHDVHATAFWDDQSTNEGITKDCTDCHSASSRHAGASLQNPPKDYTRVPAISSMLKDSVHKRLVMNTTTGNPSNYHGCLICHTDVDFSIYYDDALFEIAITDYGGVHRWSSMPSCTRCHSLDNGIISPGPRAYGHERLDIDQGDNTRCLRCHNIYNQTAGRYHGHNATIESCAGCHYNFAAMNDYGTPEVYVYGDESMGDECADCHNTEYHPPKP